MTMMDLIVYAVIFFLIILWFKYKWNRDHSRFKKLDAELPGPPAYPLIGSGLLFLGEPRNVMNKLFKLHRTYGPEPFKIWMGTTFNVVISKPEDVQIILKSSKALAKSPFYNFFKNLVGEGLFSAPVDKWRKHRRMITPVFKIDNLKQFFPIFNEEIKILIESLKMEVGNKQRPFDLSHYIDKSSLQIMFHTTMGCNLDINSNIGAEFDVNMKKGFELNCMRIHKPWLHPDIIYYFYEKIMRLQKFYDNALKLPNQVIENMKPKYTQNRIPKEGSDSDTATNDKHSKTLLDILFQSTTDGLRFTDDEIRDEVMTLMIAGTDTIAITECFCLLLLAIYPDIQDKVYNEINNVLGDDNSITMEDTVKLVYLEQVLKETLRLFPVGAIYHRQLEDDIQIYSNNYILPKGTICTISPIVTHFLPELYPDPHNFNPDNFTQENIASRHSFSFLAFSGGPRGCIGAKYAMFAMKAVIAAVLRNFSVHTDMKLNDIKIKSSFVLRSLNGYPVTIQLRNKNVV